MRMAYYREAIARRPFVRETQEESMPTQPKNLILTNLTVVNTETGALTRTQR